MHDELLPRSFTEDARVLYRLRGSLRDFSIPDGIAKFKDYHDRCFWTQHLVSPHIAAFEDDMDERMFSHSGQTAPEGSAEGKCLVDESTREVLTVEAYACGRPLSEYLREILLAHLHGSIRHIARIMPPGRRAMTEISQETGRGKGWTLAGMARRRLMDSARVTDAMCYYVKRVAEKTELRGLIDALQARINGLNQELAVLWPCTVFSDSCLSASSRTSAN